MSSKKSFCTGFPTSTKGAPMNRRNVLSVFLTAALAISMFACTPVDDSNGGASATGGSSAPTASGGATATGGKTTLVSTGGSTGTVKVCTPGVVNGTCQMPSGALGDKTCNTEGTDHVCVQTGCIPGSTSGGCQTSTGVNGTLVCDANGANWACTPNTAPMGGNTGTGGAAIVVSTGGSTTVTSTGGTTATNTSTSVSCVQGQVIVCPNGTQSCQANGTFGPCLPSSLGTGGTTATGGATCSACSGTGGSTATGGTTGAGGTTATGGTTSNVGGMCGGIDPNSTVSCGNYTFTRAWIGRPVYSGTTSAKWCSNPAFLLKDEYGVSRACPTTAIIDVYNDAVLGSSASTALNRQSMAITADGACMPFVGQPDGAYHLTYMYPGVANIWAYYPQFAACAAITDEYAQWIERRSDRGSYGLTFQLSNDGLNFAKNPTTGGKYTRN